MVSYPTKHRSNHIKVNVQTDCFSRSCNPHSYFYDYDLGCYLSKSPRYCVIMGLVGQTKSQSFKELQPLGSELVTVKLITSIRTHQH